MSLIITQKPQYYLLQWAADKLELPSGAWMPDSRAIGVRDTRRRGENSIRAVMVLNHFSAEGCEASFVSDGSKTWARPHIVTNLLTIPFALFNVPRVVARVSATARDTQISAMRAGFDVMARVPGYMPNGDDAVLFSMSAPPAAQVAEDE